MERITELKVTVKKIELFAHKTATSGITLQALLLTKKSEEIVTDRLVVTQEAVRVLGIGR